MGEVYRARDTRLDKTVALKIVAAGFADDPSSLPRFDRERRVTASLEHPHICRLLDAGHDANVDFLAMEYLEGQSLASRLRRGPLPLDDALGYAIEIAAALDYAHRRGVVHRDLKPANVYLTPTGAKVLDFGLAKLRTLDGGRQPLVADTAPLTAVHTGPVVGSASYMAPERLEGRDADHRTDIFGFGLVLYEMCTGRRAFEGASPATLIAAIVSGEAAPMQLDSPVGEQIEWVVRKCLAKLPEDRWQSIGDVEQVLKRMARGGLAPPRRARRRALLAIGVAGIALTGLIATAAVQSARGRLQSVAGAPVAFTIEPPAGGTFVPTEGSVQTAQLAVSPDGRSIVVVASGADGVGQLWLRHFESTTLTPIPGTADASYPFWSPDGRSIGFFTPGLLRRIDLAGGPARTLAAAPNGRGGSWNANGDILFAPNAAGVIDRVSAEGGNARPQTRAEESRGETSHRWPQFLPDGRRFLYFVRSGQESHEGIYLSSLDDPASTLVVNSSVGGAYLATRRMILFDAEGTLMARPFDPDAPASGADPVPVAPHVGGSSNFYGAFTASSTGVIAYASRAAASELVWFDRQGHRLATVLPAAEHVDFQLSPDGNSVAVSTADKNSDHPDIYQIDLTRGTRVRLTASRATDATPVWSPDGRQVVFRSNRERVHDLYTRAIASTAPEHVLLTTTTAKAPTSWTPDGAHIVFQNRDDVTGWDLMMVSADGSQPQPLVKTPFDEVQGRVSPDGHWLAYTSNESNRPEVYVRMLDGGSSTWQISVNGGSDPRWRGDGHELFYVSADGQLTSVAINGRGGTLDPAAPHALFEIGPIAVAPPYTSGYDVPPDGSRFLVRVPIEHVRSMPLTVLLNWSPQGDR
jgi:Tol biopolymer transport system component